MSKSVNMVILIGYIGQDPIIKSMNTGNQVAELSLGTTISWMNQNTNQEQSETEWHNVYTYNKGLIKVIENYLKKGSKVYIRGRIKSDKWTDENGKNRVNKRIFLDNFNSEIVMLDSKKDSIGQVDGVDSDSFDYMKNTIDNSKNDQSKTQNKDEIADLFEDDEDDFKF